MTRSNNVILLLAVVGIAIYGCAKNPNDAGSDRNSSKEAKAQRWEEDFRTAAAARDQFRQRLLAAEEKQAQLQKQLDQERAASVSERDALKNEIKIRLMERDTLQTHYDGFRKGLKDLLAQAETVQTPPGVPTIPTIPTPPSSSPALVGSQPIPSTTTGSALSN